ncbi:MAG TPA: Fe-S cluster assembly protein SufD [Acidimicrobiia bacterium]|nr:Fe-S cluster assembly protein SufD [Acidimicrobiia bacterium]
MPLDRATNQSRAAAAVPALADRLTSGFDVFEATPMPNAKDEQWKYVDAGADLAGVSLAGKGTPLPPGAFLSALEDRAASVTIVDGDVVAIERRDPVEVSRLSDLDDIALGRIVELFEPGRDKFAAARAAFGVDGVRVTVPAGAELTAPIVIDVQATQPGASFPYVSIETGTNSECSVVVVYRSAPDVDVIVSPQVGIHAGDGARIRFVGVQTLDFAATGVVHQRVVLGRDATVKLGEVGLGGRLGRLDLVVDHIGDGCSSEVVGVYFGERDQTLDYRLLLHHQGKRTSSDVLLKGAVEDSAQSVFTGLLKIDKDAIRTSAFETNRNLVLSENAKAHSVPNLEIECDDVICGHGSSVGPLEEEHRYYLMSRGIPRAKAEQMLIKGFFQEIIDRLPVSGLAAPVADEVFSRFVTAQVEGRL